MSAVHEIEIVIEPSGRVRVEVRGVGGPVCLELTRPLEQLLGGQVVERQHTAEYDQADEQRPQAERQTSER